jgi:hypothetical protein
MKFPRLVVRDGGMELYHVTTPEIAAIIFRDGFKDHATTVDWGMFLGIQNFEPGVWFADVTAHLRNQR